MDASTRRPSALLSLSLPLLLLHGAERVVARRPAHPQPERPVPPQQASTAATAVVRASHRSLEYAVAAQPKAAAATVGSVLRRHGRRSAVLLFPLLTPFHRNALPPGPHPPERPAAAHARTYPSSGKATTPSPSTHALKPVPPRPFVPPRATQLCRDEAFCWRHGERNSPPVPCDHHGAIRCHVRPSESGALPHERAAPH